MDILVNLGQGFYDCEPLEPAFARLARLGALRKSSTTEPTAFRAELAMSDAWIGWGQPEPSRELLGGTRLQWSGHINLTHEGASALLAHGVAVSEARRCYSQTVAEMALALILAGLRRTSEFHMAMRAGAEQWPRHGMPSKIDPRERELTGMSVGMVGFGGIGQRLAEFLAPFRVDLRVYDPYIPEGICKRHRAANVPLMYLIENCDVVVLCAANTADARRLLGSREIEALRPNAVLVNVGRSWLVDTPALVRRLEKGDLIALLDVFDQEPLETESPLRTLPNTYLTPHRAGGLLAALRRALDMLVDDLEAFIDGRALAHGLDEATAEVCLASSRAMADDWEKAKAKATAGA